jgi:hypothetical protein
MSARSRSLFGPALFVGLPLLLAGCEEPRHVKTAGDAPAPAPAEPGPEVVQPREIVGQTTTDIRDTQTELNKGAQVASQKIVAKDPITLSGNAYVSAIGSISINNIKHAIDLWHAENGRYPKDHAEFMEEIIKKNNIALPRLPYRQEYSYNAETHQLQVLEYPDRVEALKKQDDAKYGR